MLFVHMNVQSLAESVFYSTAVIYIRTNPPRNWQNIYTFHVEKHFKLYCNKKIIVLDFILREHVQYMYFAAV